MEMSDWNYMHKKGSHSTVTQEIRDTEIKVFVGIFWVFLMLTPDFNS